MADPGNRFRDDPVLRLSGQGMPAAARAYMDEHALEQYPNMP